MSKFKWSIKNVIAAILAVLIMLFVPTYINDEKLEIHYIDVGQADSILIMLHDCSMLIDAGNNGDGDLVVNYLQKQGVTKLNYLVGTHPHEDHIGGLDDVIDNFDIGTVLMPKAQTDTNTFDSVLDSLKAKNLKVATTNIGDTFQLDSAEFTILSVKNETPDELNLTSIVLRLTYGTQSFLFCGDAEIENEQEMLSYYHSLQNTEIENKEERLSSNFSLQSDVIKLGHHGSDTSSCEEFIKTVNPKQAIISVGEDNKYNHPCEVTLKLMEKYNIEVYRTDLNGTIILKSDGKSNTIKCERN